MSENSSETESTYIDTHPESKRLKTEIPNVYSDEYVHIVLTNITPWVSTRIPYTIAMKTIEPSPTKDLRDIIIPSVISLNIIDDTTTRDFGDFLTIVSLMRKRLISEYMRDYIFNHIRLIVRLCNKNVVAFCKNLACTPQDILRFLEFADDGDYAWLQMDQCTMLLNYVFANRRSDIVKFMEPLLLKHIFVNSKV